MFRHLLLDFVQLRNDLILGVSCQASERQRDEEQRVPPVLDGVTKLSSPRSVITLPCFCTVCSRPFRVSLMELKVRKASDSSLCSVFSWFLLMDPSITMWPSKSFPPSSLGPCPLVPPVPPETPEPGEPPPVEVSFTFHIQPHHERHSGSIHVLKMFEYSHLSPQIKFLLMSKEKGRTL